MPIVRNIDVTMQSEVSFDDACRLAVVEAAKTLRGIMTFRVKEAECVVEHDKVIAYRVIGNLATTSPWRMRRLRPMSEPWNPSGW